MFRAVLVVVVGDLLAADADGESTLRELQRQITEHLLLQVRLPGAQTQEDKMEWKLHCEIAVREFFALTESRRRSALATFARNKPQQP